MRRWWVVEEPHVQELVAFGAETVGVLWAVHLIVVEVVQNGRVQKLVIVLESAFWSFFMVKMKFAVFNFVL